MGFGVLEQGLNRARFCLVGLGCFLLLWSLCRRLRRVGLKYFAQRLGNQRCYSVVQGLFGRLCRLGCRGFGESLRLSRRRERLCRLRCRFG